MWYTKQAEVGTLHGTKERVKISGLMYIKDYGCRQENNCFNNKLA